MFWHIAKAMALYVADGVSKSSRDQRLSGWSPHLRAELLDEHNYSCINVRQAIPWKGQLQNSRETYHCPPGCLLGCKGVSLASVMV